MDVELDVVDCFFCYEWYVVAFVISNESELIVGINNNSIKSCIFLQAAISDSAGGVVGCEEGWIQKHHNIWHVRI